MVVEGGGGYLLSSFTFSAVGDPSPVGSKTWPPVVPHSAIPFAGMHCVGGVGGGGGGGHY